MLHGHGDARNPLWDFSRSHPTLHAANYREDKRRGVVFTPRRALESPAIAKYEGGVH
jgi:hypothetical protein